MIKSSSALRWAALASSLALAGCVTPGGMVSTGTSATAATAIKVVQGPLEALDGATGGATALFINAPQFPTPPDTRCAFGYTVVKNASTGANWTFGTSNWNATGITLAHQDLMTLPGRPQVA